MNNELFFSLSYVNFDDKVRTLHNKGRHTLLVHCVGNSLKFQNELRYNYMKTD